MKAERKIEERRKIEEQIDDLISEDSSEEGTSDNGEPRRDKKGDFVNRQADEDEEDSRAARQKAVSVPDSKEPIFEVDEEGNANVAVFDSLEMRAAFLHYCRSPILAHEMHMAPVIPQMSVPQFTAMARDMKIVEPDGPLSLISLGLTYTTIKEDDDRGLSFSGFLDALLELAFDCEFNVGARLITTYHEQALKARLQGREAVRASDAGSRSILASTPSLISRGGPRFSEASPAGRMARMSEVNNNSNGIMSSLGPPLSFNGAPSILAPPPSFASGSMLDRPPQGSLIERVRAQLYGASSESNSAPGSMIGITTLTDDEKAMSSSGEVLDRKLNSWNTTPGRFSLNGTELSTEQQTASPSNPEANNDRRSLMKRGSVAGERASGGGLTPTMALPRSTVKNFLLSSNDLKASEVKTEEEDLSDHSHPLHRAAAIASSPVRPMSRMMSFSRTEGGDRPSPGPVIGGSWPAQALQASKSSYFADRASHSRSNNVDDDDWGPTPNYTANDLKADVLDPSKSKGSFLKKEASEPASVYGASPSSNGRRLTVATQAPNSRVLASSIYSPTPPPPKVTRTPSLSGGVDGRELAATRQRESISKAEQLAASSPYGVSSPTQPQPPKVQKALAGLKDKEPPRSARRQIKAPKRDSKS